MEVVDDKRFTYEFGGFVLDPHERTLVGGGVPIHLPAKEFDTLLLLVEHNGSALRKEEMISAIWHDSFVEEGNLAKQISRLRKIINSNGTQYIETIPKHGYRFKADLRRAYIEPEDSLIIEKRTLKRVTLAVESEDEPKRPRALLQEGKTRTKRWLAVVFGLVLLTGISVLLYWRQANTSSAEVKSIAALPLRSLANDESNKVLGLGLTDALISKLGSLKQIVVRPTSAVAGFADGNEDSVEIGKRLNVDAVLEGTIQQSEGRIRINARLIRTANGEQIWTDRFDAPSNEIFALQDELSTKIAKALAFRLSQNENAELVRHGTVNSDAYEKYLRGRYYQTQLSVHDLTRSIEFYQQAVALDENFADAYAGIADAYTMLYNFELLRAADAIPQAKQAVTRALQLNPDLSDAHAALALIQFVADRDWPGARRSLNRAIALNPNNSGAWIRYGYFLILVGNFDEALEKFEKARELTPLSPIVQSNIGLTYLCARRYPEAISQLRRVVDDNPQFSLALWFLAAAYADVGEFDEAFETRLKALEFDGAGELAAQLRAVENNSGLESASQVWFDKTAVAAQSGKASAIDAAYAAAILKDRENTLHWLEKSVQEKDPTLPAIKYLAIYDFVRDDERFQAILQEVNY